MSIYTNQKRKITKAKLIKITFYKKKTVGIR